MPGCSRPGLCRFHCRGPLKGASALLNCLSLSPGVWSTWSIDEDCLPQQTLLGSAGCPYPWQLLPQQFSLEGPVSPRHLPVDRYQAHGDHPGTGVFTRPCPPRLPLSMSRSSPQPEWPRRIQLEAQCSGLLLSVSVLGNCWEVSCVQCGLRAGLDSGACGHLLLQRPLRKQSRCVCAQTVSVCVCMCACMCSHVWNADRRGP